MITARPRWERIATGSYRIYSLHENDSLHQMVAEGLFSPVNRWLAKGGNPALGKYRVKLEAKDQQESRGGGERCILFAYTISIPDTNRRLVRGEEP